MATEGWLFPVAGATSDPLSPARADRSVLVIGAALLIALTAATVVAPNFGWGAWFSYGVQALLLVAALALVVVGLGGIRAASRAPGEGGAPQSRWSRREIAALAAISAGAFLVRTWKLGDALRVLIDEGNSIDHMAHVWRPSGVGLVEAPSVYVTTMVYPYWEARIADVVGHSLAGLRLSSAIVGTATIPAVYLLGRVLFDRQIALVAAVLLAVLPPHVHFSRIALPHVMDGLFGTLAIAGAAGGLTRNRRFDWAVAGTALGLTHYGFEAGRLFFAPLIVVWLALLALFAPSHLRAQRHGFAILAAAFALTVMPVYGVALAHGRPLTPRWTIATLDAPGMTDRFRGEPWTILQHAAERVVLAARVYVQQPDLAGFYGGDTGLIIAPLVPLFLIGAVLPLFRPRAPALIVPLWIAAAAVANATLRDGAAYARWVVVLPAIALALALGLRAVAALLPVRVRRAATAILVAAAVAGQVGYYFGTHLALLNVQARHAKPERDAFDAVLRAAELPRNTDVVFISDPVIDVHPPRSLLSFLVGGPDVMRLEAFSSRDFDAAALGTIAPDRDLAFFVAPGDAATIAALQRCYPLTDAAHSPYALPADEELLLYLSPASSRPPSCG